MTDTNLFKFAPPLTPEQWEVLYAEMAAKEKADYQKYKDSSWQNLCPPIYREP